MHMKSKIVEVAVKVIVAALTAFLTAITTTSCMGRGPIHMLDAGETCSSTAHTRIGFD